ncbi:unnamed protein product [Rotaria sp. Silwood1]|nr:unnamed protein product [Rotaria sp. Silwood1]CAF0752166.1 unnamed protein product [Rotaria sp. Silwood1]CAF3357469.1 unnamed protein product [Rotaria sp. Silwood1]CAF4636782.1 unnamed protein product [Rotaria sp. Silwood1]CAF4753298.1 unnamed protein product [Rotaria sp. Silwood1]
MDKQYEDNEEDKILPGTLILSSEKSSSHQQSLRRRQSLGSTSASLVELHIHLDGSFRHSTLFELAQKKGIQLPNGMESTLENFLPYICIQSVCKSLVEFLEKFPFFTPIVAGDIEALERVAYEFVEDQAIQGILYTEARYSPHYLTANKLRPEDVIEAINRGLQRGMKEFHIDVRTILCCIRQNPEWSMETVNLADKYRSAGVVAIDLAGDEHNYPIDPHIPAFKRAVELNIHRTVHAGETGSAESVRQAIELCHAERIGHGYAIVDDPSVYDLIRLNDIHLECCLTSSIQTNAIAKYIPKDSEKEEKHIMLHGHETTTRLHVHIKSKKEVWHPVHHFARDCLNFSLSCDDPSVSQITIEHEYQHALSDLKLSPAQLTRCIFNAARSTFLNDDEKQLLIQRLLTKYIPGELMKDSFRDNMMSNSTLSENI